MHVKQSSWMWWVNSCLQPAWEGKLDSAWRRAASGLEREMVKAEGVREGGARCCVSDLVDIITGNVREQDLNCDLGTTKMLGLFWGPK